MSSRDATVMPMAETHAAKNVTTESEKQREMKRDNGINIESNKT